jgi:hypothetical protein
MTAVDMKWQIVHPPGGPPNAYALFYGQEVVAQAQATWEPRVSYNLMMWCGEGTYQVHMDLAFMTRQSEAFKFGAQQSMAAFWLESEGSLTAKGRIKTEDGRTLSWEPTHTLGYEYVIRQADRPPLITMSATPDTRGIGGNPGHMNLSADCAGDPALAALVALGFALANEQVRLLHRTDIFG